MAFKISRFICVREVEASGNLVGFIRSDCGSTAADPVSDVHLDFGPVEPGERKAHWIEIWNCGDQPFDTNGRFTLPSGPYEILYDIGPDVLPPTSSRDTPPEGAFRRVKIGLSLQCNAQGAPGRTLMISQSGTFLGLCANAEIRLQADVLPTSPARVRIISPRPLDIRRVRQDVFKMVRVENTSGCFAVSPVSVSVTAEGFKLRKGSGTRTTEITGFAIVPGGSEEFEVWFEGTARRDSSGELRVEFQGQTSVVDLFGVDTLRPPPDN